MSHETRQSDRSVPGGDDAQGFWDVPSDHSELHWAGPPGSAPDPDFDAWRRRLAEEIESLDAPGSVPTVVFPFRQSPPRPVPVVRRRRGGRKVAAGAGGVLTLGVLGSALGLVPHPFGIPQAPLGPLPLVASVDASPTARAAPSAGAAEAPSAEPLGPRPLFSIALSAHRDAAGAAARRDALAAAAPGQLFVVAPVEVRGAVFHRVLGGVGEDRAGARSAAEAISASTGEASTPWIVRDTRLAFTLDEVARPDSAQALSREWNRRGIPTYVLAVDYSDGTTGYRVLAGAYADEGEAAYLARLLTERGVDPVRLEERVGAHR